MSSHDSSRRLVWAAGLLVASGAGVATAHGLYQVAAAAGVPTGIAWLYPLITDGLALVAYAATSRVTNGGRGYAAAIVILAAGLSGLAQATYLTGTLGRTAAGTSAPAMLRFGVGAWPAIAAALTAHLLHLIGAGSMQDRRDVLAGRSQPAPADRASSNSESVQPSITPAVQPSTAPSNHDAVQPQRSVTGAVQPARATGLDAPSSRREQGAVSPGSRPARDRARQAAADHHARHGALPTVSELARLAGVARGTAGNVLKDLRASRPALHIIHHDPATRTTP